MTTIQKPEKITKAITALKILGDPTRFRILSMLFESPEGLCVYEIADGVGISHSATSHQLAKLEAHGIVTAFREGQTICYEVYDSELTASLKQIMNIF